MPESAKFTEICTGHHVTHIHLRHSHVYPINIKEKYIRLHKKKNSIKNVIFCNDIWTLYFFWWHCTIICYNARKEWKEKRILDIFEWIVLTMIYWRKLDIRYINFWVHGNYNVMAIPNNNQIWPNQDATCTKSGWHSKNILVSRDP